MGKKSEDMKKQVEEVDQEPSADETAEVEKIHPATGYVHYEEPEQ